MAPAAVREVGARLGSASYQQCVAAARDACAAADAAGARAAARAALG
jgi:hypothetical protein